MVFTRLGLGLGLMTGVGLGQVVNPGGGGAGGASVPSTTALLKGSGTANIVSTAVAGTDYAVPSQVNAVANNHTITVPLMNGVPLPAGTYTVRVANATGTGATALNLTSVGVFADQGTSTLNTVTDTQGNSDLASPVTGTLGRAYSTLTSGASLAAGQDLILSFTVDGTTTQMYALIATGTLSAQSNISTSSAVSQSGTCIANVLGTGSATATLSGCPSVTAGGATLIAAILSTPMSGLIVADNGVTMPLISSAYPTTATNGSAAETIAIYKSLNQTAGTHTYTATPSGSFGSSGTAVIYAVSYSRTSGVVSIDQIPAVATLAPNGSGTFNISCNPVTPSMPNEFVASIGVEGGGTGGIGSGLTGSNVTTDTYAQYGFTWGHGTASGISQYAANYGNIASSYAALCGAVSLY